MTAPMQRLFESARYDSCWGEIVAGEGGSIGERKKNLMEFMKHPRPPVATYIKKLLLPNIKMTGNDLTEIAEVIKTSDRYMHLAVVDVSDNPKIRGMGVNDLVNSFTSKLRPGVLRELIMSNIGMTGNNLPDIAKVIRASDCFKELEILNVSNNPEIGDKGVNELADSFMSRYKLADSVMPRSGERQKENLFSEPWTSNNPEIGDKGVNELADSFMSRYELLYSVLPRSGERRIENFFSEPRTNELADSFMSRYTLAHSVMPRSGERQKENFISKPWTLRELIMAHSVMPRSGERQKENFISKPWTLRELIMSNIGMTLMGVTKIAYRKNWTSGWLCNLVILDLSRNANIGKEGVVDLVKSFLEIAKTGEVSRMRELLLPGVGMRGNGVATLASVIRYGYFLDLEKLDLSENPLIQDTAVIDLAKSFKPRETGKMKFEQEEIKQKRKKKISGVEVKDEDMRRNFGAITTVHNMKELQLSNIGMGDSGAKSIAQAITLGHLSSLATLNISRHKFGKAGRDKLLASFDSDKACCLQNIKMTNAEGAEIVALVQRGADGTRSLWISNGEAAGAAGE